MLAISLTAACISAQKQMIQLKGIHIIDNLLSVKTYQTISAYTYIVKQDSVVIKSIGEQNGQYTV